MVAKIRGDGQDLHHLNDPALPSAHPQHRVRQGPVSISAPNVPLSLPKKPLGPRLGYHTWTMRVCQPASVRRRLRHSIAMFDPCRPHLQCLPETLRSTKRTVSERTGIQARHRRTNLSHGQTAARFFCTRTTRAGSASTKGSHRRHWRHHRGRGAGNHLP